MPESNILNKILSQYDSLSSLIIAAKSSDTNFLEIKKLFDEFGNTLHTFLIGYLEDIDALKKELNEKEEKIAETDSIIEKLNKKLEKFREHIPQSDFQYYSKVCQKEYSKFWRDLDENTKKFITTAYYILHLVKASKVDFSSVIVELSKAVEGELYSKLYIPYMDSLTAPLPYEGGAFGKAISSHFATGSYFIPFRIMFAALKLPNKNQNDYYNDLQKYIRQKNWCTTILNSSDFIDSGINYSITYRNEAAHKCLMTEDAAIECKKETKKLLETFMMARPSKV